MISFLQKSILKQATTLYDNYAWRITTNKYHALVAEIMLQRTNADKADYDKIKEDDSIDINGLLSFAPGKALELVLHHADGTKDTLQANHSYNNQQIEWFKAGAALNIIRKEFAAKNN